MKFLSKTAHCRKHLLVSNWQTLRDSGLEWPYQIDFVVLWVEDDQKHRQLREHVSAQFQRRANNNRFGFDNQISRYRDNEEIRSCLRSVFWCLPWIRRVYVVVADYQYPELYVRADLSPAGKDGPELRVVPHSAILPTDHLPTFNSQAIEANIHRLEDIAEHFIYANDDFMVGMPLHPSYFFTRKTGAPRYNLEATYVPDRRKTARMTKHSMAWTNNSRVLNKIFGPPCSGSRHYPCHVMVPMLRQSFVQVWDHKLVEPLLLATSKSPFRTSSNLYIIGLLVYWNIYIHGAVRRNQSGCFFHDLEKGDDVKGLMRYILTSTPQLFCINDGNNDDVEDARFVKRSLRALFPLASSWEPQPPAYTSDPTK